MNFYLTPESNTLCFTEKTPPESQRAKDEPYKWSYKRAHKRPCYWQWVLCYYLTCLRCRLLNRSQPGPAEGPVSIPTVEEPTDSSQATEVIRSDGGIVECLLYVDHQLNMYSQLALVASRRVV